MKVVKRISLAGLALFAALADAQTDQPVRVVVDSEPINFPDQQPTETNGHVLVPLRGVFEKLGASVDWNPSNQTITAKKRDRRVRLAIGQLDASVDDKPVHMDVPATLVGGTTMVPLRFVSEALGAYVTWNPAQHEVDITRQTNYDIPPPRDERRDRPTAPPPPPARLRNVPVPMKFGVIAVDTVLPLTLNTRLSSRNAQRGDQFTATLITDGSRHYFDLPQGTQAYGSVSYVRHQNGRDPGVIELSFDHLVLPNGRNLPIVGRLVGMDNASVRRLGNGTFMAVSAVRHDRMVFTGYGPTTGLIVGFEGKNVSADVQVGRLLQGALGIQQRSQRAHDVELVPGTQFGFRLYQPLAVPR